MVSASVFAAISALCTGFASGAWKKVASGHSACGPDKVWFVDKDSILWKRGLAQESETGFSWTQKKEGVNFVSAGFDGSVWIIDTNNDLQREEADTDAWEPFLTKQNWKQLSARSYFEVVGMFADGRRIRFMVPCWLLTNTAELSDPGKSRADTDDSARRYVNASWVQLGTKNVADWISVGFDGSIYLVLSANVTYMDWANMAWVDPALRATTIAQYVFDSAVLTASADNAMSSKKANTGITEPNSWESKGKMYLGGYRG